MLLLESGKVLDGHGRLSPLRSVRAGWLRALQQSGIAIKRATQLADRTWQVDLRESSISDLAILHGAWISDLSIDATAVRNLEPLRGMPLRKLNLRRVNVADLSPLAGMQVESLLLSYSKVTSLSNLRRMPLTELRLNDCSELTLP